MRRIGSFDEAAPLVRPEDPVVVVRDRAGKIGAFLNSRAHKGRKVCELDEGNADGSAHFQCDRSGVSRSSDARRRPAQLASNRGVSLGAGAELCHFETLHRPISKFISHADSCLTPQPNALDVPGHAARPSS